MDALMLPLGKTDPQETPLCCALHYRRAGGEASAAGDGIGWSARIIRFQGDLEMSRGAAVEVQLEAVRGLFPPLMILAEVSDCQGASGGRYEISGQIKGILTL
jgi:hypothetical protein